MTLARIAPAPRPFSAAIQQRLEKIMQSGRRAARTFYHVGARREVVRTLHRRRSA